MKLEKVEVIIVAGKIAGEVSKFKKSDVRWENVKVEEAWKLPSQWAVLVENVEFNIFPDQRTDQIRFFSSKEEAEKFCETWKGFAVPGTVNSYRAYDGFEPFEPCATEHTRPVIKFTPFYERGDYRFFVNGKSYSREYGYDQMIKDGGEIYKVETAIIEYNGAMNGHCADDYSATLTVALSGQKISFSVGWMGKEEVNDKYIAKAKYTAHSYSGQPNNRYNFSRDDEPEA